VPENDPLFAASTETEHSFFPTAVIVVIQLIVVVVP
jgi:hypothetical protein